MECMDNGLEDGMDYGLEDGMDYDSESLFDSNYCTKLAISSVNEMAGSVRPAYWDPSYD